jgi:hypothetical protein
VEPPMEIRSLGSRRKPAHANSSAIASSRSLPAAATPIVAATACRGSGACDVPCAKRRNSSMAALACGKVSPAKSGRTCLMAEMDLSPL